MAYDFHDKVIRGRDCPFPRWFHHPSEKPADNPFDSIVLNSSGISALTLAARCVQNEPFPGNVHIYGKPVEESRRLANGVTLRARALDFYAAAFGVPRDEILSRMYVGNPQDAATFEQRSGMATGTPESGFQFSKIFSWMHSKNARRGRPSGLPLAFGVRNSRLNRVLLELAVEHGVTLHTDSKPDPSALFSQGHGENPLVVNGTPFPLENVPLVRDRMSPTRCVVAVQVPFTSPRLEQRGIIDGKSSFITWVHRDGALDMGVFNPFRDDLSPTATFYGIVYRIIPGPKGVDKDAEQAYLYDSLVGIGDALGMDPVDPDETKGVACVPLSPWRGTANLQENVLDISRLSGAGAPIITGDGMTRAAVGGYVAAESLLAGRDVEADVNRALCRYRQINWELSLLMTTFSGLASYGMEHFPRAVMLRNSLTYYRDMWASPY